MASRQTRRSLRIVPDGSRDDRPHGGAGDRAAHADAEVEGWDRFLQRLNAVEKRQQRRRVVRVWHPVPRCAVWHGLFGSARVEVGAPAYQFNDGETVTV